MVEKVYQYILKEDMIRQGDTVLVGVSGGADSVCLIYVLEKLRKRLGINLLVLHVHHGIRGEEADRDAEFVKKLCNHLNVECDVVYIDVPAMAKARHLTEEEAGRIARYESFYSYIESGRAAKIAVAHNKNDNAETILFNLFRGSGIRGLGGIQPVRDCIIRPMLTVERKDIEEYIKALGIKYCTDSTNLTEDYTRNKVRKNILGYAVREINEGAIDNIVQAGYRLSEAEEYFSKEAEKIFDKNAVLKQGEILINNNCLKELPLIMRKYVIMHSFEKLCGRRKDITMKHIESTARLADNETGHMLNLPYGMTAVRSYDMLIIRNEQAKEATVDYSKEDVEMRVFKRRNEQIIPQNIYTKWFDYDKIASTLEVRTRKKGDVIDILPGGHKKTVARYMIDNKIPAEKRNKILLLADGSDILWIIGYRISEKYKVTDTTENILEVSVLKHNI